VRTYFAPGKIMLCGEYFVTLGIEALALPTQLGQVLRVWEFESPDEWKLVWQSKRSDGSVWFELTLSMEQLLLTPEELDDEFSNNPIAIKLIELLLALPTTAWKRGISVRFETEMEFNSEWGLGSSSSLVVLLSKWACTDPMVLQKKVFGGSGYDAAVSYAAKPIVYWLKDEQPNWSDWSLPKEMTSGWWVIMVGKKQNSRHSLAEVKEKVDSFIDEPFLYHQMLQLMKRLKEAKDLQTMESGLELHQAIVCAMLGLKNPYQTFGWKPVKEGICKWLGAWGGDMMLVNDVFYSEYSEQLDTMLKFRWNDLVIHQ
jgi:mevalonate kinase